MLVLYWVNLALNFMFELFLEMPSWTVFGDWKFMYHCPYFLTPQWICVYHYVIYVVSTSAKNSAKKKKVHQPRIRGNKFMDKTFFYKFFHNGWHDLSWLWFFFFFFCWESWLWLWHSKSGINHGLSNHNYYISCEKY